MIKIRSEGMIALGGNMPLGDRSPLQGGKSGSDSLQQYAPARTIVSAIAEMAAAGLMIRAVSRFYVTPCFPVGAGPDFVNAVVRFSSELSPDAVLSCLHRIESQFGRARVQRWGTRTLDLDLLCMGNLVLPDPGTHAAWRILPAARQADTAPDRLILPHPRLQDRAFVLVPMADVAPDWVHPALGQSVAGMLSALPSSDLSGIRPI